MSGPAFSTTAIWSAIVRSCNVKHLVFRGPFVSGLAFSVDPWLEDLVQQCSGSDHGGSKRWRLGGPERNNALLVRQHQNLGRPDLPVPPGLNGGCAVTQKRKPPDV